MLRPSKGEGERRHSLIKKGSQIFFVTLIFATPVCMAESALASTSGFSSIGGKQSLTSVQTQTASQFLYQSRNLPSLGGKQSPFKLILLTSADLDILKSTLSQYRSQLASLKSTPPSNPENAKQLAVLITDVEADISSLSSLITQAERAYNNYLTATETFRLTKAYYNAKLQAEQVALAHYNTASSNYIEVANVYNTAKESFDASVTRLQSATEAKEEAQSAYDIADASLTNLTNVINQRLTQLNEARADKSLAEQNLVTAQQEFNEANNNVSITLEQKQQAYQNLQQAQYNYDNNLIPDPSWIHPTYQQEHTRQVEQTTTQLTGGLQTKVYNRQGYNNAPPMPSTNETPIHTTTVPNVDYNWGSGNVLSSGRSEDVIVEFKGLISPTTSGYYRFYTPADDGTRLYINNQFLIDDWYDKGGGGSVSEPIYLEANNPVPVTLFYYENGGGAAVSFYYYTPTEGYRIVPAAWLGTQTQTTTTYVTETYYTTELVPGATAPLIKNPALLAPIQTSQSQYDVASDEYNLAVSNRQTKTNLLGSAQDSVTEQASKVSDAEARYNLAVLEKENASPEFQTATTNLATANAEFDEAVSAKTLASSNLETATTNEQDASAIKTASLQTYTDAQSVTQEAYVANQKAEATQVSSESVADESFIKASVKSRSVSLSEVEALHAEPKPEEEKLPEVITSEAILDIDLTKIDPTTMTEEQAEQLKEAALEIFLTAEEGSAEYQQALDALYLASEQDDIVLDPALAAIPGLQAATDLVNFFGNAGSDMSPKTREKSEKVVVAAVVAAGAAIQSAAAAASTASASTRRIGN